MENQLKQIVRKKLLIENLKYYGIVNSLGLSQLNFGEGRAPLPLMQ